MLIAWTGALVNSSNVFLSIKGSKLRVLKELVTIDFARRVAFRVHYMGALSPYFWWQGHCTNNRELGVSISLLLFFLFFFQSSAALHSLAIKYEPWLMNTIWMKSIPRGFFTINTHFNWAQRNGTIWYLGVRKKKERWELRCNCSLVSQGETIFLHVAFESCLTHSVRKKKCIFIWLF